MVWGDDGLMQPCWSMTRYFPEVLSVKWLVEKLVFAELPLEKGELLVKGLV